MPLNFNSSSLRRDASSPFRPNHVPSPSELANALIQAAAQGDRKMVKRVIRTGLNVDFPDDHGQTALIIACRQGNSSIVRLLLSYGADPNRRRNDGMTSVHEACCQCNESILAFLIEAGGDLRLHDGKGRNARDCILGQTDVKKRRAMLEMFEQWKTTALNQPAADSLLETSFLGHRNLRSTPSVSLSKRRTGRTLLPAKLISNGFGKVCVEDGGLVGTFGSLPFVAETSLSHDQYGYTYDNGPFFIMESMLWNNEPVTVKRLHSTPVPGGTVDMLITEHDYLARLHHPSILLLMGVCRTDSLEGLSLVYERVASGSLYAVLHQKMSTLDYVASCEILIQVSNALLYLHHRSLLHCNISSHSIQLTNSSNIAKLGNFEYVISTTTMDGAPPYSMAIENMYQNAVYNWLAPEVIEGLPVTERSDLYSLCVVLWELVHGKMPWHNMSAADIRALVLAKESALEINEEIGDPFSVILHYGLSMDQAGRQMSIEQIRDMLSDYISDQVRLRDSYDRSTGDGRGVGDASRLGMLSDTHRSAGTAGKAKKHAHFPDDADELEQQRPHVTSSSSFEGANAPSSRDIGRHGEKGQIDEMQKEGGGVVMKRKAMGVGGDKWGEHGRDRSDHDREDWHSPSSSDEETMEFHDLTTSQKKAELSSLSHLKDPNKQSSTPKSPSTVATERPPPTRRLFAGGISQSKRMPDINSESNGSTPVYSGSNTSNVVAENVAAAGNSSSDNTATIQPLSSNVTLRSSNMPAPQRDNKLSSNENVGPTSAGPVATARRNITQSSEAGSQRSVASSLPSEGIVSKITQPTRSWLSGNSVVSPGSQPNTDKMSLDFIRNPAKKAFFEDLALSPNAATTVKEQYGTEIRGGAWAEEVRTDWQPKATGSRSGGVLGRDNDSEVSADARKSASEDNRCVSPYARDLRKETEELLSSPLSAAPRPQIKQDNTATRPLLPKLYAPIYSTLSSIRKTQECIRSVEPQVASSTAYKPSHVSGHGTTFGVSFGELKAAVLQKTESQTSTTGQPVATTDSTSTLSYTSVSASETDVARRDNGCSSRKDNNAFQAPRNNGWNFKQEKQGAEASNTFSGVRKGQQLSTGSVFGMKDVPKGTVKDVVLQRSMAMSYGQVRPVGITVMASISEDSYGRSSARQQDSRIEYPQPVMASSSEEYQREGDIFRKRHHLVSSSYDSSRASRPSTLINLIRGTATAKSGAQMESQRNEQSVTSTKIPSPGHRGRSLDRDVSPPVPRDLKDQKRLSGFVLSVKPASHHEPCVHKPTKTIAPAHALQCLSPAPPPLPATAMPTILSKILSPLSYSTPEMKGCGGCGTNVSDATSLVQSDAHAGLMMSSPVISHGRQKPPGVRSVDMYDTKFRSEPLLQNSRAMMSAFDQSSASNRMTSPTLCNTLPSIDSRDQSIKELITSYQIQVEEHKRRQSILTLKKAPQSVLDSTASPLISRVDNKKVMQTRGCGRDQAFYVLNGDCKSRNMGSIDGKFSGEAGGNGRWPTGQTCIAKAELVLSNSGSSMHPPTSVTSSSSKSSTLIDEKAVNLTNMAILEAHSQVLNEYVSKDCEHKSESIQAAKAVLAQSGSWNGGTGRLRSWRDANNNGTTGFSVNNSAANPVKHNLRSIAVNTITRSKQEQGTPINVSPAESRESHLSSTKDFYVDDELYSVDMAHEHIESYPLQSTGLYEPGAGGGMVGVGGGTRSVQSSHDSVGGSCAALSCSGRILDGSDCSGGGYRTTLALDLERRSRRAIKSFHRSSATSMVDHSTDMGGRRSAARSHLTGAEGDSDSAASSIASDALCVTKSLLRSSCSNGIPVGYCIVSSRGRNRHDGCESSVVVESDSARGSHKITCNETDSVTGSRNTTYRASVQAPLVITKFILDDDSAGDHPNDLCDNDEPYAV